MNINLSIKEFMDEPSLDNALRLVKMCDEVQEYEVINLIYPKLLIMFPSNMELIIALTNLRLKLCGVDIEEKIHLLRSVLLNRNLDENTSKRILLGMCDLLSLNLPSKYEYPDKIVEYLTLSLDRRRLQCDFKMITLTITSCKRLDLFKRTINSFLINVIDIHLIDRWVCVDDNTSEEDRREMKRLYPFFEFIDKDLTDKGHARSMNIIRNTVNTPYILHLEDDWEFILKGRYISDCLDVLASNENIGQCLFNKNYSEILNHNYEVKGGEFKTTKQGQRYFIHEYVSTETERVRWLEKHGAAPSSNYWPHFSFRPSLIRTNVFKTVGEFNESACHFEMEYAYRYVSKGYISAFLEGVYCIHIGRLTSEINNSNKINAYKLNSEAQFVGKNTGENEGLKQPENVNAVAPTFKFETYAVNLDRRVDRWDKFLELSKGVSLPITRFSAVDGFKLKSTAQLQRIFDGNDYNMLRGAVGCAMSHFKLYIQLIYSASADFYLILEDDIEFALNFDIKLDCVLKQLCDMKEWDMCVIGHHMRNQSDVSIKEDKLPIICKFNRNDSFNKSIGGTFGYLISKQGAERFLDFTNNYRMINCIDTMIQNSADTLNIYYLDTHLVYSECYRVGCQVDTDIQGRFDFMTISTSEKISTEKEYLENMGCNILELSRDEILNNITSNIAFVSVVSKDDGIFLLSQAHNDLLVYSFDDLAYLVFYKNDAARYAHRFKNLSNIYCIDDCFI